MKAAVIAAGCHTAFAARIHMKSTKTNLVAKDAGTDYSAASWKVLITGSDCPASTPLTKKDGGAGDSITCAQVDGKRHFRFPAGTFDIDEQVEVPANTVIEGNANPNDPSDKRRKLDPSDQTFFIATGGVSDVHADYCGTEKNLEQGDAQKLRFGFLMNSNTKVKNINYQGQDTVRPYDNGSLCGGAVFETPGCVSPGFGDGNGWSWLGQQGGDSGCFDHAGGANDLITGDGKGVENVDIENVRLNDLYLPEGPSTGDLIEARASQIAVWVAQTQDGSPTKNVHVKNLVSMALRGDGINFHGSVQDSSVEDSHIENTGDDIFAVWGGYTQDASGIVFRNNVGRNAGVTRNYGYGVCIAVYGAMDVEFTGNTCYDLAEWNAGQYPAGNSACLNGPYCNSCMAYIHGNWFGAIFPENNAMKLNNNEYLLEDGTPITDRPWIRNDAGAGDNIVADVNFVTCTYATECK